jgi:hypothetical protein
LLRRLFGHKPGRALARDRSRNGERPPGGAALFRSGA